MRKTNCVMMWVMMMVTATAFAAEQPRIVNVYNFIRNSDYRVPNSEQVLFDCTRQQLDLVKKYHLPTTWALQYDALINQNYQKLLKENAQKDDEIAAWWELPRPLVEKAGLKWRGAHDWDSASNVGFSPGYTPDERKKLVDVYMADFKSIFGYYPKSVGSWYLDEVTLAYMAEKYGVIASCNCKDQVGTDGYTLWGGYWNGAYYPSKLNAYMPAQTKDGQINVPIFRMLGSDPIYQYGRVNGMSTLEPVYKNAGGSQQWVEWFFRNMTDHPSLAFAYTQAGQENSFGFDAMKTGLTLQFELLAKLRDQHKVRIETLATSGKWFRKNYPTTPATAMVYLDDFKNQGRKTVWYNSRFYRANFLWRDGTVYLRDLHLFDEKLVSPTHEKVLTEHALAYGTLPVMDGSTWLRGKAGGWIEVNNENIAVDGEPSVVEKDNQSLQVDQAIKGGGKLTAICSEKSITIKVVDKDGKSIRWTLELCGGKDLQVTGKDANNRFVTFSREGLNYRLVTGGVQSVSLQADGSLHMTPNEEGELSLSFGN